MPPFFSWRFGRLRNPTQAIGVSFFFVSFNLVNGSLVATADAGESRRNGRICLLVWYFKFSKCPVTDFCFGRHKECWCVEAKQEVNNDGKVTLYITIYILCFYIAFVCLIEFDWCLYKMYLHFPRHCVDQRGHCRLVGKNGWWRRSQRTHAKTGSMAACLSKILSFLSQIQKKMVSY